MLIINYVQFLRVYAAVVMDLCAIYIALNKLEFSNSALTQAQLIEN